MPLPQSVTIRNIVFQNSKGQGAKVYEYHPYDGNKYNLNAPYLYVANAQSEKLREFDICVPMNNSPQYGFMFRAYYIYMNWTSYTGNDIDQISDQNRRRQAYNYFSENRLAMFQLAEEFAAKVTAASGSTGFDGTSPSDQSDLVTKLAAMPILSQANAVGQGFDIYGELGINSLIRPLFDYSKAGTQVFDFLGKSYLIPSIITAVQDTSSSYTGGTYESREDLQNSYAAKAGVEASYGAFSGEMKADFTGEYSESALYAYGYTNFYTHLAYLELNHVEYLTPDFQHRISQLPNTADLDTLPIFEAFFRDFGIYYTQRIVLGGSLEFFVSLSQRSGMSKETFSAMLKAQYEGLVLKGGVDASISGSQDWKTYQQNRRTSIRAIGGSPVAVSSLSAIDPNNPSSDTVNKYNEWVSSVSTDPAIIDFALHGIWELCGDNSETVRTAWTLFSQKMHPRLVVETSSTTMDSSAMTPHPPVITIGNSLQPAQQPASPTGYQVVIFDGTDLTNPNTILLNRYYTLPKGSNVWAPGYRDMYEEMRNDIVSGHYNSQGNILILSSFGLDVDMPPTNEFYELLQTVGAGDKLRYWEHHSTPGSMGGHGWITTPACYTLVGVFGTGPDTGIEAYSRSDSSDSQRLEVIFYREAITGQYTLGTGS